jgi:hypothetical protein
VTAAAADEAFGFLLLSLRRAGELPFLAPAFTARLEVSYHKVRPRRVRSPARAALVLRPDVSAPQGAAPVVPLSLLELSEACLEGKGCYCRVWTLWHSRVCCCHRHWSKIFVSKTFA